MKKLFLLMIAALAVSCGSCWGAGTAQAEGTGLSSQGVIVYRQDGTETVLNAGDLFLLQNLSTMPKEPFDPAGYGLAGGQEGISGQMIENVDVNEIRVWGAEEEPDTGQECELTEDVLTEDGFMEEEQEIGDAEEMPEEPETSKQPEEPETEEEAEEPETSDGIEAEETPETSDGTETEEKAETLDGTGIPEKAETPDGTGTPEKAEMPDGTETPDGTEEPETEEETDTAVSDNPAVSPEGNPPDDKGKGDAVAPEGTFGENMPETSTNSAAAPTGASLEDGLSQNSKKVF